MNTSIWRGMRSKAGQGGLAKGGVLLFIQCSLLLFATQTFAEGPVPGQGNPVDSLPRDLLPDTPPVSITLQKSDANSALSAAAGQMVTPAHFNIDGVHSIPFELVAKEFSPMANQAVSVAALVAAAERVTKLYRDRGYPLSFAYVPAQNFDKNIVEVNIVEGYVEKISFTGNASNVQGRLETIAARLRTVRPLTNAAFQRITGLMQLEPSVQISASVTPPVTTDGASEMTVNVKRSPVTLSVNMDTTTSRLRGLVSATENGATALGEQITISTLQPQGTDRERYYALNYAQPIGADGVLMQVNVYDYAANPRSAALLTQGLESEYESRTTRAAVTVGYPFILDAHRNLTGTAGFYAAQNANTFAFQNALAPDIRVASQTRALSLEYSWQLSSETSLVQASGGIYQGLGMLGAGATNNTANVRFNRIRGQFSRTDVYAGNWGTVISGIAQYSGNVLPQTEQISFGGRLFGMGYAASNSTGDSGWGLAVEGNRSFVFDTAYLKRIQAYVVLDKSQTVLNALPQPHGNLGSVGLGLRLSDMRYYSVDVSVAKPTGERPVNEADRALRYNLLFNYKTQ